MQTAKDGLDTGGFTEQDRGKVKMLDRLFLEVGTYKKSSDFRGLFNFIRRCPHIAPFNAHLLHVQKPKCRFATYASTWREEFGRTVKPDARPLIVLVSFGPVGYVFDLDDTEGEPFPEKLLDPPGCVGVVPMYNFNILLANLPCDGIFYKEANVCNCVLGRIGKGAGEKTQVICKNREGADVHGKILYEMCVQAGLPLEEKFATILHELAHLHCGHLGTPDPKLWPDRRYTKKNEVEFEAESVAWLVCERMGLKNPSVKYLSNYLNNNAHIPNISLFCVLKAVKDIEEMLKGRIPVREGIKV